MRLTYLTGRARAVRALSLAYLKEALAAQESGDVIFLVPDQYTLQAEIDVLSEIAKDGFFHLQVLSPRRLCSRVFDQAGSPGTVRVDEQGRVMLMHAAARDAASELAWYGSAVQRAGFAEKCVRQIAAFKQAGLFPEDLRAIAGDDEGALGSKLRDLACLYERYEASLAGRFMDGEDEMRRACERIGDAPFLRGARVCVYGFDLITQSLRRMILSLLKACDQVAVALTLEEDARDGALFSPVKRSLDNLSAGAREMGVNPTRERVKDRPRAGDLGWLERELFCVPQRACEKGDGSVSLYLCKNPAEEAEFAAGMVLRLCRERGWRYRDFAVVCVNGDEAAFGAVKRAFSLYHVPLFLTQGRSADHHPLGVCLLSALAALGKGWRLSDMTLYIRSGFTGLTDEEADVLVNYAQAHGLRGRAWREMLKWGAQEEIDAAEPLRARVAAPLIALEERARRAGTLTDMLAAIFGLLEDLGAYDQLEARRQALEGAGLGVWAAEGAQVWNRVVEALDQMALLLGERKMRFSQVHEMLARALGSTVVKALPQSADAVEGGTLERMRGKPVKALIVLGATDAGVAGETDLLGEEEVLSLRRDGIDVGMNAQEMLRMRRLGIKSLMNMTESFLMISRAGSDAQGRALPGSLLMNEVAHLLPGAHVRGGVTGDREMLEVRLSQADAALCLVPGLLKGASRLPRAALKALERMEGMEQPLARMRASFRHKVYSETLDPPAARRLLAPVGSVSATRLEKFAACPFQHFARYALRPEIFIPFSLTTRDAGNFYHEALEKFVARSASALGTLTGEDAQGVMDGITSEMIGDMLLAHAGQGALARAQGEKLCRIARRAAGTIARQLEGSRFQPSSVELGIARDEVRIDSATTLSGRIDRIDLFKNDAGESYVRVIDYKTGGRTVSLQRIYYGLEMQLALYLTAAAKQLWAKPAGAFYFKVDDPLIDTDSRDPQEVEDLRAKELRLDGLLLRDRQIVNAMARYPETALHVAFNSDGSIRKSDKTLETADLAILLRHALRMAREMLSRMRQGDTSVSPALCGGSTPCDWCEYKTLCGWDACLDGASARKLPKLSAQDVLSALRAEENARAR